MKSYKAVKGNGTLAIGAMIIAYDVLIIALTILVNSYVLLNLLRITLLIFNGYFLYYLLLSMSLQYTIDEKGVTITGIFKVKNIRIPFEQILAYQKTSGTIKGVKLSGVGKNNFAFGKSVVDKIGTTSMFVTCCKNVVYLKTEELTYALSPKEFEEFGEALQAKGVELKCWKYTQNKGVNLYKEKTFFIPFCVVSILTLLLTLNPLVLYLMNKLPPIMPLSFDSNFIPIKTGTGKQFAFYQMMYGVLNMAILFCMYYASYFYAKYDRKSAYKFIYIPLFIVVAFIIIQLKILFTF